MALARRLGARSAAFSTARVFPNFTTYGSDSAFQVSPNAPQYTNSGTYLKTKRAGSIMLSWAKATNSGYDYNKKTFFSLSPSEVGLVLELLDAKVSELSLSHSVNMNTDDPKKKVLQVTRAADPEGNPMVLLKVADDSQAVAALNTGEARVFRELLVYSLPRLFGFHSALEAPLNVDNGSGSTSGGDNGGSSSSGYRGSNAKPADDWPF